MSDAAQNPKPATGPRTEAGKRRSRANARTHGLTAKLPNCESEAAQMQEFADRWTKELAPDNLAEAAIIRASAMASARLERYCKSEEATLRSSALRAVERWEDKKRKGIRARAQSLANDPFNTVADLETTSFGCEWMMRHWQKLDAKLAQGLLWADPDVAMTFQLLGYYPQNPGPDADSLILRVGRLCGLVRGVPVPAQPGEPGNAIEGRVAMRKFISEELDRLDTLRQEIWDETDSLEAEAVAQAGMAETTKEGQLRKRYAKEAYSEMTRGIHQVMRLRMERSRLEDREWAQAHPHLRRGSGKDRPITEYHVPPCIKQKATPPADSRNEPQIVAQETANARLNPNADQEMRREPSVDSPTTDPRSEPRFTASNAPVEAPRNPDFPPVEGVRTPIDPALTT